VTERRGRRRRKLLDDLKVRGVYFHLKGEALDRTMWRARFGRGFGPVVRRTDERMNNIGIRGVNCKTFVLTSYLNFIVAITEQT